MNNEPRSIEAKGANVEEAISIGLARLNLAREDVDVEVLDEGSRGLLGIGSRAAIVVLAPKQAPAPPEPAKEAAPRPKPAPSEKASAVVEEMEVEEAQAPESAPEPVAVPLRAVTEVIAEEEVSAVMDVIHGLLSRMSVEASVSNRLAEPDDVTGERVMIVDIVGEDLGPLIGPRGETLDSFQYIARLMAGHTLQRRTHFVVDVEGYRERRSQALARLAERMADKASQRGRPMTLEPMPPYERRIIHMTLRDSDLVYTESTGEGSRRRVRIYPKEGLQDE